MLFLVISTPAPSSPDAVRDNRRAWQEWAAGLTQQGTIQHWYLRAGRGAAVIFDVASNDDLHALLIQWLRLIPAHLDTYPLVSPEAHARGLGE